MVVKIGLQIVRSRLAGSLFSKFLWPMIATSIPKNQLRQSEHLVAFFHPQPSYAYHVLLVPKKSIPSFSALGMEDRGLLSDLVQMVNSLVEEYGLEKSGYRLIMNGGKYQDVPQLHWHLVSDERVHSR